MEQKQQLDLVLLLIELAYWFAGEQFQSSQVYCGQIQRPTALF